MKTQRPRTLSILRAARGLAQADLAVAVGVSIARVSEIERGHRPASTELLACMAHALDCPLAALTGDEFVLTATRTGVEVTTD